MVSHGFTVLGEFFLFFWGGGGGFSWVLGVCKFGGCKMSRFVKLFLVCLPGKKEVVAQLEPYFVEWV